MARKAGSISKERFNSELPNYIHEYGEALITDLGVESFTELIRRGLGVSLDFWDQKKRSQPVAIRDKENRIQIVEDPIIERSKEIKRKNFEIAAWWHRKVEDLAQEQNTSKVAIVCKEILLVKTLKEAVQIGGEIGHMINEQFRPVIYELLIEVEYPLIKQTA